MAAVIQAAGQANLMDSVAAGNYEDARSKLIEYIVANFEEIVYI